MRYKIVENTKPIKPEFYVLYKKNFFSRWIYVKNQLGLITYWDTKKSAEIFIQQEKLRLGLIKK